MLDKRRKRWASVVQMLYKCFVFVQNICRPITFVQYWTNVGDVGPALYKCYTNVLCLLGNHIGPALAVMGI